VLIGEPPRFDKDNEQGFNFKKAKFNFRLNETEARYGLYIEKSNKEMDATWEWNNFLKALQNLEITVHLEQLMAQFDLHFLVEIWEEGAKTLQSKFEVVHEGSLTCINAKERRAITWNEFVRVLEAIPESNWCDVNLGCVMPKKEAIACGAEIANSVVDVYIALLPLYDACKNHSQLSTFTGQANLSV
jgi:hypothetical protein